MTALTLILAAGVFTGAPCGLAEPLPPALESRVECGWVTVPRDSARPSSPTIRLWTARIRASGTARRDPIVYLNGGPGIATVDAILPVFAESKTWASLAADRDIILFDQRGSGRSDDALCPELIGQLEALEAQGLSPVEEDERERSMFVACRASLDAAGVDLDAYSTATTVDDMEAVRTAYAVERWNLVSVSYGSLIALHALRARPGNIRSAILNSPYPPNSASWAEQVTATASAYQAIDRACTAQPSCAARFGPLIPKLEATLARLEQEPVRDGERQITGRLFAGALWPLAVRSSTVHFVPLAIERAHAGDENVIRGLVRTFAGGGSFGAFAPAQAMAISCHEGGRTREWYARARALYPSLTSKAPDDSWDRLCAAFRPGFAEPAFFAPVASDVPVLLYAGSLDPATPTIDAYMAVRFLNQATIAEVQGAAHAPMGLDDCTRGIATAFLDRPESTPDTSCLAERPPLDFAETGLAEILDPAE